MVVLVQRRRDRARETCVNKGPDSKFALIGIDFLKIIGIDPLLHLIWFYYIRDRSRSYQFIIITATGCHLSSSVCFFSEI